MFVTVGHSPKSSHLRKPLKKSSKTTHYLHFLKAALTYLNHQGESDPKLGFQGFAPTTWVISPEMPSSSLHCPLIYLLICTWTGWVLPIIFIQSLKNLYFLLLNLPHPLVSIHQCQGLSSQELQHCSSPYLCSLFPSPTPIFLVLFLPRPYTIPSGWSSIGSKQITLSGFPDGN